MEMTRHHKNGFIQTRRQTTFEQKCMGGRVWRRQTKPRTRGTVRFSGLLSEDAWCQPLQPFYYSTYVECVWATMYYALCLEQSVTVALKTRRVSWKACGILDKCNMFKCSWGKGRWVGGHLVHAGVFLLLYLKDEDILIGPAGEGRVYRSQALDICSTGCSTRLYASSTFIGCRKACYVVFKCGENYDFKAKCNYGTSQKTNISFSFKMGRGSYFCLFIYCLTEDGQFGAAVQHKSYYAGFPSKSAVRTRTVRELKGQLAARQ